MSEPGLTPHFTAAQQIAEWLRAARSAVAFTGAGISTESGIPDFRSPGGVWAQSQPVYFDEFLRRPEARYEYWRQKAVSHRDFENARPNIAHTLLAEWEARETAFHLPILKRHPCWARRSPTLDAS